MSQSLITLAGAVTGGVAAYSTYPKTTRILDTVCVTAAGAVLGFDASATATNIVEEADAASLANGAGFVAATVAGVVGWNYWRKGKGHSDAGGVGIGLLGYVGVRYVASLIAK